MCEKDAIKTESIVASNVSDEPIVLLPPNDSL